MKFPSILDYFGHDMSKYLHSFFEEIARLETDLVIVMARKALRLYDLHQATGGKPSSVPVYSHHILDMNLDFVRHKTITLIDDTLIAGSTLSRAKSTLERAGAERVDVLVAVVDAEADLPKTLNELALVETEQKICEELLERPDFQPAYLPREQTLSFCAAEVRLSLIHI